MRLIIGLGNPGKKYEQTRHNAGFLILDEIRQSSGFPEFQQSLKFNALTSEKILSGEKFIFAKPQDFMNKSGDSVKKIMDFYKIPKEELIVIHDDLDIDLGAFKISYDSSAAGHNGVQSIINQIKSQQFKRIRIGIEGMEGKKARTVPGEVFVLQNFSTEEMNTIKKLATGFFEEIF